MTLPPDILMSAGKGLFDEVKSSFFLNWARCVSLVHVSALAGVACGPTENFSAVTDENTYNTIYIISTCLTCCNDVWEVYYVQWSQAFPWITADFSFPFAPMINLNGTSLWVRTSQTALDFWSMTSSPSCLDWTSSGLLHCYSHNPFQNNAFVATLKAEAGWNIETALSLSQCSLADGQTIMEVAETLKGEGQTALGFCTNPVSLLLASWGVVL